MSNTGAVVAIIAADALYMVEKIRDEGGSLQDQFRAACEAARDNWMAPPHNEQLMGAVAALLEAQTDDAVKEEIMDEARAVGKANALLNAILSGVPVDYDSLEKEAEPKIGLAHIFREVCA